MASRSTAGSRVSAATSSALRAALAAASACGTTVGRAQRAAARRAHQRPVGAVRRHRGFPPSALPCRGDARDRRSPWQAAPGRDRGSALRGRPERAGPRPGGCTPGPGGGWFNRPRNGYRMACNPPQGRPAGCHRPVRWDGRTRAGDRAARAIHKPGFRAWRAPCGKVHAGPGDETGNIRTTVEGMPWALMVLSWVLHQVPRRRGKCSPVICRTTGCMVGCGR